MTYTPSYDRDEFNELVAQAEAKLPPGWKLEENLTSTIDCDPRVMWAVGPDEARTNGCSFRSDVMNIIAEAWGIWEMTSGRKVGPLTEPQRHWLFRFQQFKRGSATALVGRRRPIIYMFADGQEIAVDVDGLSLSHRPIPEQFRTPELAENIEKAKRRHAEQ